MDMAGRWCRCRRHGDHVRRFWHATTSNNTFKHAKTVRWQRMEIQTNRNGGYSH